MLVLLLPHPALYLPTPKMGIVQTWSLWHLGISQKELKARVDFNKYQKPEYLIKVSLWNSHQISMSANLGKGSFEKKK